MGTISRRAINKWKTGWFSKGLNTSNSENYRKSWMNHALIYNKDTISTYPAMQEHCCSFIWLSCSWTLMDKTWGGWVLHCERWAFASIIITFSFVILRRHIMLWIYFSNAYCKPFCLVLSDICEPQLLQKLVMVSFRRSFSDMDVYCSIAPESAGFQTGLPELVPDSASLVTVANVGLDKNGFGWDLAKG